MPARIAILVLASLLGVAGCSGMQGAMGRSDAQTVETQLQDAGFHLIAADTPERINAMHAMTPLSFSRLFYYGRPYYVYADPDSCLCLWVGSPAQYQHFLQLTGESQMSTEQMIAKDVEVAANLWDPEWGSIDDPTEPVIDPDLP